MKRRVLTHRAQRGGWLARLSCGHDGRVSNNNTWETDCPRCEGDMMDFDDYCKLPAMNWSRLKDMRVPRLFKYRETHPRPDTASLSMGRAVHLAVLEPGRFDAACAVKPDDHDGRTKEGKAWSKAQEGRHVVDRVVLQCRDSVLTHPEAMRLLEGCAVEQTIQWTDADTGAPCKARLDAVRRDWCIDLKTTSSLKWFHRDADKYLYHGQAAWYLDAAIQAGLADEDASFYLIAVSTSEDDGFETSILRIAQDHIDAGRRVYRTYLDLWSECKENNIWPRLFPAITVLGLGDYAEGMNDQGDF